jgi:hypothetical protein
VWNAPWYLEARSRRKKVPVQDAIDEVWEKQISDKTLYRTVNRVNKKILDLGLILSTKDGYLYLDVHEP